MHIMESFQSPVRAPRKDSVAMGGGGLSLPASPTREAALTSHPVLKEDLERGRQGSDEMGRLGSRHDGKGEEL